MTWMNGKPELKSLLDIESLDIFQFLGIISDINLKIGDLTWLLKMHGDWMLTQPTT